MPSRAPGRSLVRWGVPAGLFLGTFLLVAATFADYGLAWDEPAYFQAADLEVGWLADLARALVAGRAREVLRDDVIRQAWRWDVYQVPHPPVSRILSGISHALLGSRLDRFTAYRLPQALFLATLVTVMYLWLAAVFDRLAGLFSALATLFMPNLFGFAHFAMTDLPLATLGFLTAYCFWRGLRSAWWSVLLGVVWGTALATKFPAFLLPIPLLLWAHIFHRRSYANNAFAMLFLSPGVMVAWNPYWWHQTVSRVAEFVQDSTSRPYRWDTDFLIVFFGRFYRSSSVPAHYPFAMTAFTVPEIVLALSLVGAGAALWRRDRRDIGCLFLVNAAFILSTGLVPGAVLHDVNRLMLPVLPWLCALAGFGFFLLAGLARDRWLPRLPTLARAPGGPALAGLALMLVLTLPALHAVVAYHPYELSYYNRLVGGLPGAAARGLEVTYLLEAVNPRVLAFLNRDVPPEGTVNGNVANVILRHYQKVGRLRDDIRIVDGGVVDRYLLLNRATALFDHHRAFLRSGAPAYVRWELHGVPLIWVYQLKEIYERKDIYKLGG